VVDWTETWRQPAAFLLIVAITSAAIHLVGRFLLRRIPNEIHTHPINRIFGIFPGLVNGLVMAAIISALMMSVPFSDRLSYGVQQSRLAEHLVVVTDEIEDALLPIFHPAIKQTLNKLITIEPGSDERVELPFRIEHPEPA